MKLNKKIKGVERIIHAAVKTVTGYAVIGKCHADCFYSGQNMGLVMSKRSKDQGFITNKGRYVDRKTAARIAKRAHQLQRDGKRKVIYLLSEDIWYQRDRFEYNQTRGYFEIK